VNRAPPDTHTVTPLSALTAGCVCRSLAIIGLVKNAGKTTVVNALLAEQANVYGLTSLGLDGESTDHLTGLAKPRISPPPGTLVATTRGSLERSRYPMDILEELPFHTPLGRVVIGRASGRGQVEVSGPTTLAELRTTIQRLQVLGAGQVLVDGAINRIGCASPRVTDGVIVATGGMVGDTLRDALEATEATLEMLMLPAASAETRALIEPHLASGARAVAFTGDGRSKALDVDTVVGEGVAVARAVVGLDAHTLYVAGALTGEFVDDLTRVLPPRRELRVVVRDATVLVLTPSTVSRCRRRGIALEVVTPIRVLALTANPFRVPQPYQARAFFDTLVGAVGERVPVFDVVSGHAWLPRRRGRPTRSLPDGKR
jgi:hypothetical protein